MNRGRHRKSKQHLIVQILGITVANRMMECQKEQGNIPNLNIFLRRYDAPKRDGGFNWGDTVEGFHYWNVLLLTLYNNTIYQKYKNDRR